MVTESFIIPVLSALSLLARYTADSQSDFSLADESIHAYSTYLIEFRPLSILIPVFIFVPPYRRYLVDSFGSLRKINVKYFVQNMLTRKSSEPVGPLFSNRLRPISARTVWYINY